MNPYTPSLPTCQPRPRPIIAAMTSKQHTRVEEGLERHAGLSSCREGVDLIEHQLQQNTTTTDQPRPSPPHPHRPAHPPGWRAGRGTGGRWVRRRRAWARHWTSRSGWGCSRRRCARRCPSRGTAPAPPETPATTACVHITCLPRLPLHCVTAPHVAHIAWKG